MSKQASERMSERSGARAKLTVRSKQTGERCERTRERTSEWPSTYILILGFSNPPWICVRRTHAHSERLADTRAHAKGAYRSDCIINSKWHEFRRFERQKRRKRNRSFFFFFEKICKHCAIYARFLRKVSTFALTQMGALA